MIHINPKIIGITGGIATGKSTVSNFIKSRGYKVIDADEIAKKLMVKDNISYKKTVEYFGDEILNKSGEIDRKALGNKVFSDSKLLKVLNDITHPYIFQEIKNEIDGSRNETIIFLDIPLLFEEYDTIVKYGIHFDEVWLVFADKNTQIYRLMKRNSLTEKEAISRIEAQIPIDEKKEKGNRIIFNSDSMASLKENLDFLLKSL